MRSHSRLKNKWEAQFQIAIKDKKVLGEDSVLPSCFMLLTLTLTLFLTVDKRIVSTDFCNTIARKSQNAIEIDKDRKFEDSWHS